MTVIIHMINFKISMKKLFVLFFVLAFFLNKGVAQNAVPVRDTALFFFVVDMNNATDEGALPGDVVIVVNDRFYNGHNFPFSCFSCHNPIKNSLYLNDFKDIINLPEQKKFIKNLMKSPLKKLDDRILSNDSIVQKSINSLKSKCLKDYKRYRISYMKAVIIYFLIDCKITYGVDDVKFCEDVYIPNKTPVILRVKGF